MNPLFRSFASIHECYVIPPPIPESGFYPLFHEFTEHSSSDFCSHSLFRVRDLPRPRCFKGSICQSPVAFPSSYPQTSKRLVVLSHLPVGALGPAIPLYFQKEWWSQSSGYTNDPLLSSCACHFPDRFFACSLQFPLLSTLICYYDVRLVRTSLGRAYIPHSLCIQLLIFFLPTFCYHPLLLSFFSILLHGGPKVCSRFFTDCCSCPILFYCLGYEGWEKGQAPPFPLSFSYWNTLQGPFFLAAETVL